MSEYPSYLIHYGIQGQKWGVRRFQNEDGTYTDEGLLRRKDKKYFVKEQTKVNRKFDRVTDKIQARTSSGKRVSDRQINKAVELGTRHRALDYISKNPQAYLKARGLNKASKANARAALATGAASATAAGIGLANGRPDSFFGYGQIAEASISSGIARRKLEKMFLNNWMQRQYGDILNECRNMTISDLESHGIKVDTNSKSYKKSTKKFRVLK